MSQEVEKPKVSQTQIHIYGALALALLMGVALGLAPYFGKDPHQTQIHNVQMAAKADLQLMLEAEKTFYSQYQTYTTDMNALAVAPKSVLYKIGFVTPAVNLPKIESPAFTHRPELKDYDALKAAIPKLQIAYSPLTKLSEISINDLGKYCADCTAHKDGFRAIAAANLDDDADLDIWTIEQSGTIVHVRDDLEKK